MPRAEWRRRAEFAEAAEALGVPTSLILMVLHAPNGQPLTALWTPEAGDNPEAVEVWSALLLRGPDGVLRASRRQRTGTLAELLWGGD